MVLFASPALAQGGACVLITDKPPELAGARGYVLRVGSLEQSGRNEKPNHLRSGMRLLLENDRVARNENQMGRAYLLGKLLALWTRQDGANAVETRKTLGLSGDPNATVDLYKLIDSAFTEVEKINPACGDSTRQYREAVFSEMYNPAVSAVNARQYDSALVLAERALVVAPRSGKAWNLIAQAKYGRNDLDGYADALLKVIEYGPTDPALKGAVEQAYMNLGTLYLQRAQQAQGEAKQGHARQAADVFRRYTEYKPDDPTGKVRLANALQILGDSSGVDRIYEDMLKDPSKFTSTQLAEAGVASYRGERYEEALVFFEESLKQNPYHPQTLFNYINTSIAAKKLVQATERLPKLFEVDPSNVANFTLAARAWQGMFLDSTTTVEQKQMGQDSTIKYIMLRDSSDVNVVFAPFAPAPGNAQTLGGTIENRTEAAKSYDLSIECLDAKGNTVATATVAVPDVGPKSSKPFRATCTGANIAAFRYKPVS